MYFFPSDAKHNCKKCTLPVLLDNILTLKERIPFFISLSVTFSAFCLGWPNVPKVELEISTPLQIQVLNEISAWLKL